MQLGSAPQSFWTQPIPQHTGASTGYRILAAQPPVDAAGQGSMTSL